MQEHAQHSGEERNPAPVPTLFHAAGAIRKESVGKRVLYDEETLM